MPEILKEVSDQHVPHPMQSDNPFSLADTSAADVYWKHCGIDEQFLLLPQCFHLYSITESSWEHCGRRRNCSFGHIVFKRRQKVSCIWERVKFLLCLQFWLFKCPCSCWWMVMTIRKLNKISASTFILKLLMACFLVTIET